MTGLLLEDGELFPGEAVGADGAAFGEAVFATAMTGYQELVTDPSYAGQILCFTAPMVGNYGVSPERSESAAPQVRAVVMREARGPAWTDWLAEHGVVGLTGVDTRALVLHLREHGAMRAGINATLEEIRALPPMAGQALAGEVSTTEPYVAHEDGDVRVAVVDYGCKRSIVTRLAAAGAAVTVYPHDVDADELAGVRRRPALERARRPRSADETRSRQLATWWEGCPCWASASATSCWRWLPATRRTSCPSATAARTTPCSRSARAACSSPARTTASPSARARSARRRTSRSTTARSRDLDYPELRARSLQFHPEAGPGPHDAHPLIESWVEELRCRGVTTSTRSASSARGRS